MPLFGQRGRRETDAPARADADRRNASFAGNIRRDFRAMAGEFIGTTAFLMLGYGVIQAAAASGPTGLAQVESYGGSNRVINPNNDQVWLIAAAWGLSYIAAGWTFYRWTGSVFSPNISFALWVTGCISFLRFVLYFIAQIVASIVAAAIVAGITPGPLAVSTTPGAGANRAQAVWLEIFYTAAVTLALLMIAAEKHRTTPWAPVGIGLMIFVSCLVLVPFTGASLNTARSFGPAVITGFDNRHWIYWVGPFAGSALGAGLYYLSKWLRYWRVSPGQDATDPRMSPGGPLRAQFVDNDRYRTHGLHYNDYSGWYGHGGHPAAHDPRLSTSTAVDPNAPAPAGGGAPAKPPVDPGTTGGGEKPRAPADIV